MPWRSTDPKIFPPEAVEYANLQEQRMIETFRELEELPRETHPPSTRGSGFTLPFGDLLPIVTVSKEQFEEMFKLYADGSIPDSFN